MKTKYDNLSVNELEKEIEKFKNLIEEIEEERALVLGQTGIHLAGSTVKKYAAEIAALKENVELLEKLLLTASLRVMTK